jgi:hypothetical protein
MMNDDDDDDILFSFPHRTFCSFPIPSHLKCFSQSKKQDINIYFVRHVHN